MPHTAENQRIPESAIRQINFLTNSEILQET
jgi:hypothetical protein